MDIVNVKIKKLHPDAIMPEYQSAGAACFDLHAIEHVWGKGPTFEIATGLAVEIPEGYVMFIYSRSGHGFKHGIRLVNSVGVIDSDFRGEIKVKLRLDGVDWFEFMAGDRVAQAMIVPIPRVEFEIVDDLSETSRGTAGFGSTGY